ncbi:MAG: hypothetical protein KBD26_03330 [Candidatus Pacebacteria bacterium]|nr:hypothetical protein [Candidatus Paceibacterota bacterium]MBP9772839.1 hypothetical protein [Candidatus Paceibacterota bacterium]
MRNNYFKILFIFTLLVFTNNMIFASGSDVVFKYPENTTKTNSPFYLSVLLDASGDDINAIEGTLYYDDNFFELVDIVDGNSVVTSWVKKPVEEGGKITFSGIMAGGYLGTIEPLTNNVGPGVLFELILLPKTEGSGSVTLTDTIVYKNDGLGTSKNIATKDISIESNINGFSDYIESADNIRPLVFSPIISKNPDMFENRYFLVFDTQDKESGIDHFEVREGRRDWVLAESPYVLQDQTLKSHIRVKAVDKAGNERVVSYGDRIDFPISILSIPIIIILIIIISVYFWYTRKIRILSVK